MYGPTNEARKSRLSLGAVIRASALGALVLAAGPVLAQEDTVVREADKTEYKKKTIIDFSDVTIQGELTKPEGSYLLNRKKTSFKMLLKPRDNFIPELVNSIDNL